MSALQNMAVFIPCLHEVPGSTDLHDNQDGRDKLEYMNVCDSNWASASNKDSSAQRIERE